jgi:hypothetical protein
VAAGGLELHEAGVAIDDPGADQLLVEAGGAREVANRQGDVGQAVSSNHQRISVVQSAPRHSEPSAS